MMNMFSIFDPSSSSWFSLNWLSILLIFSLLPYQFWLIPSRFSFIFSKILNYIFSEFKTLLSYSFSNLILLLSLLTFIFFNNFLGLFPYIFTASSHMSFSMSLSLSFWLGIMIYSLFKFLNDTLAHLTPQGTPFILMPFMVIIESISLIIRPLTLAIRLTANMIAGHMLLSLLGNSGPLISSILILSIMLSTQFLLFILEMSVSIIQAYVFSILSTLYSSET